MPKPPRPPDDGLAPPAHLNATASARWCEILAQHSVRRVLAREDRDLLALYCDVYARWCKAREQLDSMGLIVKGADGKPIPNPYLAIADTCAKEMRLLLGELGLTPAARRRLQQTADQARPVGLAQVLIQVLDGHRSRD
jgi:P27 family predicted phage terminase small subunit